MRKRSLLKALIAGPLVSVRWAGAATAMRMWVPASPGGGWDTTAHALGDALLAAQEAAIVNYQTRSGAAGTIGLAQFAADTVGDANALLVMGSVMLGGIVSNKPPVNLDAVTPLARLTSEYNVIVVPPQSPYRDMSALLRAFQNDAASIRWGGGSRGATEHIVLGLLAQALGLQSTALNYVPFRGGGEAAAAVLSSAVMAASSGISEFLPHIQAGRMRALAITAPDRLAGLDVPTLRELGLDVVMGNWRGVYGASGLSPAQRDGLIARIQKAVQSPLWQRSLTKNHWHDDWLAGDAFATFVAQDLKRITAVMAAAGLR